MSFECEHCGFKNNEVQSGDKIQEKGSVIKCVITSLRDLDRQVIKSDYATLRIPEIEFEIPPQSKRGGRVTIIFYLLNHTFQTLYLTFAEVTTVEGILSRSIAGLEQDQPVRRALDPESAEKIENFIKVLVDIKSLKSTFTLVSYPFNDAYSFYLHYMHSI